MRVLMIVSHDFISLFMRSPFLPVATRYKFLIVFFILWISAIFLAPESLSLLRDYALFSLLGFIGAVFANATGAGGGVVFIPMFNQLNFSEAQALATSFAIQCFGMTAGAITWLSHFQRNKKELHLWQEFSRIIILASSSSVLGLLLVHFFHFTSPSTLHYAFSWFSLVLGLALIILLLLTKPERERSVLNSLDKLAIILISFGGGILTAWLSVGIGELLAVYLILRRFNVTLSVATAVIVSAITVWVAIWQHTLVDFQVYWQVVLFAGPSAILGGIFAKTVVTHLSARKLKLFFALWLLISALASF